MELLLRRTLVRSFFWSAIYGLSGDQRRFFLENIREVRQSYKLFARQKKTNQELTFKMFKKPFGGKAVPPKPSLQDNFLKPAGSGSAAVYCIKWWPGPHRRAFN